MSQCSGVGGGEKAQGGGWGWLCQLCQQQHCIGPHIAYILTRQLGERDSGDLLPYPVICPKKNALRKHESLKSNRKRNPTQRARKKKKGWRGVVHVGKVRVEDLKKKKKKKKKKKSKVQGAGKKEEEDFFFQKQ